MAILPVRFLWRARTRGDFPIHMASGGHVRVNRLKPRASIYAHTDHAQSVDLSWFELWRVQWRDVVLFMRDPGRSLQVVHYIPSPN